jgi:hypothetical protein
MRRRTLGVGLRGALEKSLYIGIMAQIPNFMLIKEI